MAWQKEKSDTERLLKPAAWRNAKTFKKSPPKIRLQNTLCKALGTKEKIIEKRETTMQRVPKLAVLVVVKLKLIPRRSNIAVVASALVITQGSVRKFIGVNVVIAARAGVANGRDCHCTAMWLHHFE